MEFSAENTYAELMPQKTWPWRRDKNIWRKLIYRSFTHARTLSLYFCRAFCLPLVVFIPNCYTCIICVMHCCCGHWPAATAAKNRPFHQQQTPSWFVSRIVVTFAALEESQLVSSFMTMPPSFHLKSFYAATVVALLVCVRQSPCKPPLLSHIS